MKKKTKVKSAVRLPGERYDALKVIWKDEGIDAALDVARKLGFTKYAAYRMIGFWMFPKETLHTGRRGSN